MNLTQDTFDCGCIQEEMMEGAMCESCGHTTCIDCAQNINTTDENHKNWKCYEGFGCNMKDEFDITGRDIINMILPSEEEE